MTAKIVGLEVLVALAGDMNSVMKLEPAIITEGATVESLTKEITNESKEILSKDKLSDQSWATLTDMGLAEKALAGRKAAGESTPAKPAKTAKPPKAPAAKPPKAPAAKPPKAPAAKPPKAPAAKPAKTPKEKKPRYTRDMAFAEALKSGAKDEAKLLEKADALYMKATGSESNPKEAKWTHTKAISLLKALGLVTEEDGKVNYKG